jgi:hypothetical protein
MSSLHKNHIDNFLSNFHENIEFIYGGITENTLEERRTQHIIDKQPTICNSWVISKKAITTINIKDINKLDNYKTLITEVEQYLINELNTKYGNKCQNGRNRDGQISQRGGSGVQLKNLQVNDAVKFYIFYK